MLAGLADSPNTLAHVLDARDTRLMIAALRSFGIRIDERIHNQQRFIHVTPPHVLIGPVEPVDCGLAGTVMRFVPPVAALTGAPVRFIGDAEASKRPMAPLLNALRQLGVQVSGDRLPFEIDSPSPIPGSAVEIDSSASSQFISALLLAGARFPGGIDVRHRGTTVPSLPHIEMTVAMLRERGVRIDDSEPCRWIVRPGAISGLDEVIEPDLTNASVFLAAGVLTGGSVTVPGWPAESLQPGAMIIDILHQMGAATEFGEQGLTARSSGPLHGIEIDLSPASELTPVVAALAAFAVGPTVITGVAHIRGHETDRLAAMEAELSSLGIDIRQTDDGLVIVGCGPAGAEIRPTRILSTYADHRLAHLEALIGLLVPGVQVDDISAVSKTMPDFLSRWHTMLNQCSGPNDGS